MLLVIHVGLMGAFRFKYLSMAFRKSGKPGQDVCLVFLKRTFIVYFVFVMVDCIFVSECLNRLEFGFVLQLGKIVASIEQKPVSLNDIVTCRTPIKNESDY